MKNIHLIQRFKQGLLLSAFLLISSDASYGFGALQLQQQIQQSQAEITQLKTEVGQLQQALANEKAAHQQASQNLNECQIDRGAINQALQNTQAAHQQAITETAQTQQTLENTRAAHEQAITAERNSTAQVEQARQTLAAEKEGHLQQINQLQTELANARANGGGGGGDPEQIALLQQEIERLRQQIAQGGGDVPPPVVETVLVGVPVLNNIQNFIHNIPPVVVDPQLDIDRDNLITNIRGNDPNVIGGLLGDLLGRVNLPNGNPQRIATTLPKRRNISADFESIRVALSNPAQIDWEALVSFNTQLAEGQEGAGAGGMMGQLKRYSDLAQHGGQTFINLKTDVEHLLNLKNNIEHTLRGNAARQEQEDLRTFIEQADQELQVNAAPPHVQMLNILSDKANEIEVMLPQLTAIVNQIDHNMADYENAVPNPVPVSPRSYEAKTQLLKIMNLIKAYNIPELSKFLLKGVQKGLSPSIANHLLILDDVRAGLLMSSSPIINFRGKIPVNRTAFEDLIVLVTEFNNLYNPLDDKRKDAFIIRDNSSRFNQLRQQIVAAIPNLPDQAMNQLLNRIIHIDPLALANGQDRNNYVRDIGTLKNYVTTILDSEASDPALVQDVSPIYSLCNLFVNIAEASSQMVNHHNKTP